MEILCAQKTLSHFLQCQMPYNVHVNNFGYNIIFFFFFVYWSADRALIVGVHYWFPLHYRMTLLPSYVLSSSLFLVSLQFYFTRKMGQTHYFFYVRFSQFSAKSEPASAIYLTFLHLSNTNRVAFFRGCCCLLIRSMCSGDITYIKVCVCVCAMNDCHEMITIHFAPEQF